MMKNLKRGGYVTLIVLVSAMMVIIPVLAFTYGQMMKFSDLAGMLVWRRHQSIAVLKSINKSIEFLSGIYDSVPEDALLNPDSSVELLVHEDSEVTVGDTISSEIYNMNYLISGDIDISNEALMSDIFKFPPARITVAGEKHFLIKTTVHKDGTPSYRDETAVSVTPSGNATKLWSREIVIY